MCDNVLQCPPRLAQLVSYYWQRRTCVRIVRDCPVSPAVDAADVTARPGQLLGTHLAPGQLLPDLVQLLEERGQDDEHRGEELDQRIIRNNNNMR